MRRHLSAEIELEARYVERRFRLLAKSDAARADDTLAAQMVAISRAAAAVADNYERRRKESNKSKEAA